ncbi:ComF family protein [Porticoccaceae bacterium]|nr:ComF family protein [Porticoccaceae bacterium]
MPINSAPSDAVCADCQQSPPLFRRCIAAFEYQQPISNMISRIKVDAYAPQLRQLTELLAQTIDAAYGSDRRPDLIIPMLLHWSRQLRRGFNQSQGIAQILAGKLGSGTVDSHCLRRRGYRRPQHLQGKQQRLRSMQGAFRVWDANNLGGRTVALVDDVVTTGASANSAAKSLLAAGVCAVDIWCIARTGWYIDAA